MSRVHALRCLVRIRGFLKVQCANTSLATASTRNHVPNSDHLQQVPVQDEHSSARGQHHKIYVSQSIANFKPVRQSSFTLQHDCLLGVFDIVQSDRAELFSARAIQVLLHHGGYALTVRV